MGNSDVTNQDHHTQSEVFSFSKFLIPYIVGGREVKGMPECQLKLTQINDSDLLHASFFIVI